MCCSATGVVLSSRRLAVDVEILPGAPAQKHGTRVHVHLGTSVVLGRLHPSRSGGLGRGPRPGARRARRRAAPPGGTAAGATWRSPRAPLLFTSDDDRWRRCHRSRYRPRGGCFPSALRASDAAALVLSRVRERGTFGCPEAELPARCGLSAATTHRVIRELEARGQVWCRWAATGSQPTSSRTMRATLLRLIDAAHAADPLAGRDAASLTARGGGAALASGTRRSGVVAAGGRGGRDGRRPDRARRGDSRRSRPARDACARVDRVPQGCKGLSLQELEAALARPRSQGDRDDAGAPGEDP